MGLRRASIGLDAGQAPGLPGPAEPGAEVESTADGQEAVKTMFEWDVNTPLSRAELAMAASEARAYQAHKKGLDIRPDLHATDDLQQLKTTVRELQMIVYRLAVEVERRRSGVD